MKPSTILDSDLSKVPIACVMNMPHSQHGVWFSMRTFHAMLEDRFDFLDVITYGAEVFGPNLPIRRAVVGVGAGRHACRFPQLPKAMKKFTNLHSKMVIGFPKVTKLVTYQTEYQLPNVFVGSHNFVGPTLYEIMLEVRDSDQRTVLLEYFESFWTTKPQLTKQD